MDTKKTCATCRYYVKRQEQLPEGSVEFGDCIRFPPQHVINALYANEYILPESKISTPGGGLPTPSSTWKVAVEHASAYHGVTVELPACGEYYGKPDTDH